MRKILLAFDGTHFSHGAFEFARRMNEKSPVFITAIFLPEMNYANVWTYAEGVAGRSYVPRTEDGLTIAVEKNMEKFKSLCEKNNIKFKIHEDFYDFAIAALRKETRFADLLIIGSESFYENLGINEPNESVKDILRGSECPVLIVPEKFRFPGNNVIAYDGTEDSVFAIKHFTYLFPEYCENHTLLAYAKPGGGARVPDEDYIEELVAHHFPALTLLKLQIRPHEFFHTWVAGRKGSILVCGAFGRSVISQIFKESAVTSVIRDHKLPVFIAHR